MAKNPTTLIELNLPTNKKTAISFEDLISHNFVCQDDLGRPLFDKLAELPEDLFFRVKRFTQDHLKIDRKVDVPAQFNLPEEYVSSGEEAAYECTGAIIHIGTTLKMGHYVSLIKKEKQWFYISDAQVTALTDEEAKEQLSRAYILNYRKLMT